MTLNNHTFVSTGFYRWGNCREWEKPCGCCLRITPWETPWELLTSHLLRVRDTFWELPALHLESERNPESCLYTSNTLRVRDTLRAAYITHTLWEWEKPWELLIHIKHLESERNLESCLHHTLWEWETLWELPASHLVRVRDTLRAAYITTCESVRKTLRQLPSETLCESFTWRDFLWALV